MAPLEVARRTTSAVSVPESIRIPISLMAPTLVARVWMRVSRSDWKMASAAAAAISWNPSWAVRPWGASLPVCTESRPIRRSSAQRGRAA